MIIENTEEQRARRRPSIEEIDINEDSNNARNNEETDAKVKNSQPSMFNTVIIIIFSKSVL